MYIYIHTHVACTFLFPEEREIVVGCCCTHTHIHSLSHFHRAIKIIWKLLTTMPHVNVMPRPQYVLGTISPYPTQRLPGLLWLLLWSIIDKVQKQCLKSRIGRVWMRQTEKYLQRDRGQPKGIQNVRKLIIMLADQCNVICFFFRFCQIVFVCSIIEFWFDHLISRTIVSNRMSYINIYVLFCFWPVFKLNRRFCGLHLVYVCIIIVILSVGVCEKHQNSTTLSGTVVGVFIKKKCI